MSSTCRNRCSHVSLNFHRIAKTYQHTFAACFISLLIVDNVKGQDVATNSFDSQSDVSNPIHAEATANDSIHSSTDNPSQQSAALERLKTTGWSRSRFNTNSTSQDHQSSLASFDVKPPNLDKFNNEILPILHHACIECHGSSMQEGNLRVDILDPNLQTGNDLEWWNDVFAALTKSEMPPRDNNSLSDQQRADIVNWLSDELQSASIARRDKTPRATYRRMTKYEYNYALQDLLGEPWNFAKDLPPDAKSPDGFQNNADMLGVSASQLETYHRLNRQALQRVTAHGAQPPTLRWAVTMDQLSSIEWSKQDSQLAELKTILKDEPDKLAVELMKLEESFCTPHPRTYYLDTSSGRTAPATWEYYEAKYANAAVDTLPTPAPLTTRVAVLPAGSWLNVELGNQLPDEGILRVRVRAYSAAQSDSRPPSIQLHFGWQASNEGRALLRVSDQDTSVTARAEDLHFYEWDIPLGEIYPRNSVRDTSPMGAMPSPSEYIRFVNSSASAGDIVVDYVEVESPVYDIWPPASHRSIFFDSPHINDEQKYASEIFRRFMRRAWRRSITGEEAAQKLRLFNTIRADTESFDEAILEVLATVLTSPFFLYIGQPTPLNTVPTQTESSSETPTLHAGFDDQLSPHELATRLSMFLWCSIPDERLLQLAENGSILNTAVLEREVERMLADPRSHRFVEHFVTQWLDMELLEFTNFRQHIPSFDPLLKEAMHREPVSYVQEILDNNRSLLDLIHADYVTINERLAQHYGAPEVFGNEFRRVPLVGDHRRGGLLTQAGLLAMNSDYPDSHPLKRGKWVLVSMLNDPPPPPPPAVPQIDLANPAIAQMTLKERIEDHRNQAACRSCHMKLDPWGIAFENFDALGQWRDQIRGKPVDASSELASRQRLDGIQGLKEYILDERQDQFVCAMVNKVSTYALGRSMRFTDHAALEQIAARVRSQGDGLQTLITSIVTSKLFQTR